MAILHIIIDGYNFLHASAGAELDWTLMPLEEARSAIVEFLATHRGSPREQLTVVFDGARSTSPGARRHNLQGIEILFSEPDETADDLIARIVHQAPNPRALLIVSSDRAVADNARRAGGKVITSPAFLLSSRRRQERRAKAPPPEPPEKFKGVPPGDVRHWRKIFGLEDEEQ